MQYTAPFNNISRDKCIFWYSQRNVGWLPASDFCRALFRCLNCAQRFAYRVLGSSQKLGRPVEHLIDGSKKSICWLSFKFRVRMLLKGAVIRFCNLESAFYWKAQYCSQRLKVSYVIISAFFCSCRFKKFSVLMNKFVILNVSLMLFFCSVLETYQL